MSQEYLSSLIAVVVLVVLAARQVLPRRVALNKLWVTPVVIAALGYWVVPNAVVLDRAHWPALGAVLLLIGAVAGVAMGLVNRVEFDPATRELHIPGSFLTLLAWMALAMVKLGAEYLLEGGAKGGADLATALALTTIEASVIARRLVWYLKCRGALARAGQCLRHYSSPLGDCLTCSLLPGALPPSRRRAELRAVPGTQLCVDRSPMEPGLRRGRGRTAPSRRASHPSG